MKIRERLSGIWLMAMTLLSLFAYTIYFVAQMWLNILHTAYLTLAVLQCATLIIYLWGPEKLTARPLKVLYRVLYASSVCVIPAFLFIFMGLVIFPEYTRIELTCEKRPAKSDGAITWCSGAAFQHDISLGFTHENIDGDHAILGVFYESPHNKDSFAAFTFAEDKFSFAFDNPSEAIREAADKGGSGFMQFGLIRDGETVMNISRPRARCYRTLAELNGNLCVIDSVRMLHFEEFMEELHRLGVTNALYMDMGAGWNYSWYRDALGRVVSLFGLPVPWSHNWIVFRK